VKDHHERFGSESWLLHQDNAAAHSSLSIREFLAKNNIAMLDQPHYSSDLDPATFFSSPNSRRVLKGTHFKDSTTIKKVETKKFQSDPLKFLSGLNGSMKEENAKVHPKSRSLV